MERSIERSIASFIDWSWKHTLPNGMTILCFPLKTVPKVSMQLWYRVGSKDEIRGQKGLAHFLEHMLFKGTKKLSEVDIIKTTDKLSGYCNAFTSYDYTAYVFDFPNNNWKPGFEMLADTMRNCTFKQELLDSELAAVIQEIKLYKDDYEASLEEEMISALFSDHPYHYPIIGYKQDLWSASREDMLAFYHKHYIPNNATLVVVGDVNPSEVFETAEHYFASIKPDLSYAKPTLHYKNDLSAKSITLYRDIQQPLACVAFVVPGIQEKKGYILDLICWLLANGRGSRLYKKLVNQLELVTDIAAYTEDLFEHGVLFITFNPKNVADCARIHQIILEEIKSIIDHGVRERELIRAIKQTQTDYLSLFEDYQELTSEWGRTSLAAGPHYLLTYLDVSDVQAEAAVRSLLATYCRPIVMHSGLVLPLPEEEHEHWSDLQEASDEEAEQALASRVRTLPLEEPFYTNGVVAQKPLEIKFPHAHRLVLSNGSTILHYDPAKGAVEYGSEEKQKSLYMPTINVVLELKAKYVDTKQTQGLYNFVMLLLLEGTQNYTADQLADEFETYGMSLDVRPGFIELHMLSGDLEHGLALLTEILCRPLFDVAAIEKVREQIIAEIKEYWDDSFSFIDQIAKDNVYKEHPHAYNVLGTLDTIAAITRENIVTFYRNYISPQGTMIAVVGDCQRYNLPDLFERTINGWSGGPVADTHFSAIVPGEASIINYPINRDQVVLCFAGLSVSRTDPDYDALMIFDQIFSGGSQGSMNSKLFQLREQSGLFYTVRASVLAYVDKEPGMIMIKTLISVDRVQEVQDRIHAVLKDTIKELSSAEVEQAIAIVINGFVEHIESNKLIAHAFLFLQRYGFPADYFDTRAQQLSTISVAEIKKTVEKITADDRLYIIRVGRIEDSKKDE